ncbi:MAG: cysteine desulfurase family protein [bacterium]|nr:cysteine desulfurase family protein [bacterium]
MSFFSNLVSSFSGPARLSLLGAARRIYADWAATAPMHPEVKDAMASVRRTAANPSSLYREGVEAKRILESFRTSCAHIVSARPDEVYFTSGGTEANNTVIRGITDACMAAGANANDLHLVSTSIEHSSVLEPLRRLASLGAKITFVDPGQDGVVRAEDILAAVRPNTVLVTCMLANNEIGTVQQVSRIGAGLRKLKAERESDYPIFHVDACQTPLWMSCDMEGMRADAMTLDGHKMQGPKGVGALVLRRGIECAPLILGGGQERGMRATTESLELIAGFTKAFELAHKGRDARVVKAKAMRNRLVTHIERRIPDAAINGTLERRLPNNLNVSLPNISDPEFAVIKLDEMGIACSTKSSCLKGEEDSYVVAAMLKGKGWRSRNTLRFTLDPDIDERDVDRIADALEMLAQNP